MLLYILDDVVSISWTAVVYDVSDLEDDFLLSKGDNLGTIFFF